MKVQTCLMLKINISYKGHKIWEIKNEQEDFFNAVFLCQWRSMFCVLELSVSKSIFRCK